MKVYDFEQIMEKISPLSLQEKWDNSGWQLKLSNDEIINILVALEINMDVVYEAISQDIDLIVTHHPLIFGGINYVDINEITGNYINQLIKNNISVYSIHTNFDIVDGGNNDYFGELIGFEKIGLMDDDESQFSRIGFSSQPIRIKELVEVLEEKLKLNRNFFSLVGDEESYVNKIGWCTGTGSDFIELAYKNSCDLFITGDVKYHVAQKAKELGIAILDVGHFGSENIFTENFYELFKREYDNSVKELDISENCNIIKSHVELNPFSEIS